MFVPLAILALAGVIATTVGLWVALLVGTGTLGAIVGAAIAAYRHADLTRASAIGGGAGVAVGVLVLVTDVIWG